MNADKKANRWKWMAPAGLSLIGMGISVTGEAIILKSQNAEWWIWVLLGTLGLLILNSGVAVFGEAVKLSTLDSWRKEHESSRPTNR